MPKPMLASFDDTAPDREEFLQEIWAGLGGERKTLPAKYFYDERGSSLFDEICATPEYYPTRTETALLGGVVGEIADLIGKRCCLLEYGTGSSEKMRIVLDALDAPAAYVAVDISREPLLSAAKALAADYPDLDVHAVCADYSKPFGIPPIKKQPVGRRVAFFPGSSFGNFEPPIARDFFAAAIGVVGRGGGMLIGIDLKKDESILNAAYNDARGVTAAFNLNLLIRINRELNGTFDLGLFFHRAFYNSALGRIEMHLVSLADQSVTVAGRPFRFRRGESIHTENSYKYEIPEFQALARRAGFTPLRVWTDPDALFSIHYLTVPTGA